VNALFLVLWERKVSAHIQLRLGPMVVGPHGVLQTVADAIKLVGKELIRPDTADPWTFRIAPLLVFFPVILVLVTIPASKQLVVQDLNVGLFFILAFSGVTVISIFMAGWSGNNKYSLLGAVRSVSQVIAYELPIIITALTVVLMCGTLKMTEIVEAQKGFWYVFKQPLAFLIYVTATIAETNRTPFDIPEAESELVAGYHTEFTGMRFALFFLAEYSNLFIVSAVATTLFLGGWLGPFLPGPVWFLVKCYFIIFLAMWVRWTYPRLRSDQLLNFSWKVLIPLALINFLVTSVVMKI
jgi:NADH-quinone oxidoreductase subunit H